MIRKQDYMVAFDEQIGIIYSSEKAKIKVTNPDYAKEIKIAIDGYFENKLNNDDKKVLEEFLDDNFGKMDTYEIEKKHNLKSASVIQKLQIMIANACNLQCKYCYAGGEAYGKEEQMMSPEMARIYLDKLILGKYECVEEVCFFGGEPTLGRNTINAICSFFADAYVAGKITRIPNYTMVSNGTLLDPEMTQIIREYGINVTISIDGPREINDLLRVDKKGNGTYDRIYQGIKNLNKNGIKPVLLEATYTSIHKKLGYTKEQIAKYLKDCFGVDDVLVADCEATCDGSQYEYNSSGEDRERFNNKSDLKEFLRIVNMLERGTVKASSCDAGLQIITLMPNGDLYPCQFFCRDEQFCVGRFTGADFELSNYASVIKKLEIADKYLNERCKDCWAKSVCSICPAALLVKTNNKNTINCDKERERKKKLMLQCIKSLKTYC